MKQKLTDRFVREVKSRSSDSFFWDTGTGSVVGLGLKVTKSGKKSFIFQYRAGVGRKAKVRRIVLSVPSSSFRVREARAVMGRLSPLTT